MSIVERAAAIAVLAHEGQMRKDAQIPYITHAIAVAVLLARHGFSDTVVAAALAHDVLEDTSYSAAKLREELGEEILHMVTAVTHDNTLPWMEKKKKYIECVRSGTAEVKALATADKICNLESLIAAHARLGEKIWMRFNRDRAEKIWFEEAMLEMLRASWRHTLVDEYARLLTIARALP